MGYLRILVCCILVAGVSSLLLSQHIPNRQTVSLSTRLHATSSSDLKKSTRRKKKRAVSAVASRLAKAAEEASAEEAKEPAIGTTQSLPAQRKANNIEVDALSSINKLSQTIDEELLRPRDGYRPPSETSSMRILLEHNEDATRKLVSKKSSARKHALRDVALVFSKPLHEDQISVEYAARLKLLAKRMGSGGYQPSLICFCGSSSPKGENIVSETAAGVLFFRHLCMSNQISLEHVEICVIDHEDGADSGWSSGSSLRAATEALRDNGHLELWLDESEVFESATDEYGMTREEPRKKIHVHFTLVSGEYHLCNVNDIHVRSPRQSPLNTMIQDLEHSVRSYKGLVETTWSFEYATYPYVDSSNDVTSFLGKCFVLAQKLMPLLVNMRGVSKQEEFFQRDNYRALVATRRALVSLLEETNEAFTSNELRKDTSGLVSAGLKAQLQQTRIKTQPIRYVEGVSDDVSVDVALESALLSLGRCADVVRPAGRLTSQSVSRDEWQEAIHHLERFMDLTQQVCDPDEALPSSEWGQLEL